MLENTLTRNREKLVTGTTLEKKRKGRQIHWESAAVAWKRKCVVGSKFMRKGGWSRTEGKTRQKQNKRWSKGGNLPAQEKEKIVRIQKASRGVKEKGGTTQVKKTGELREGPLERLTKGHLGRMW